MYLIYSLNKLLLFELNKNIYYQIDFCALLWQCCIKKMKFSKIKWIYMLWETQTGNHYF